jgi:diguanylate cyclase (GGDEF)-like protein
MGGEAGYQFAFDAANKAPDFFASYPVRDVDGKVVGAAVLQKSLAALQADLRHFDHPYFLVDGDGIVVLTNQPEMLLRALWPLSPERKAVRGAQLGGLNFAPMVKQEIADSTWIKINGSRDYARRRLARGGEWSLVMLKPTKQIFASRVVGIAITLLITIMALIYLSGRERAAHDQVQMDKRLQLQDLARNLRFQATTDPLTGLNNRLQFNQALAAEILRSDRYAMPFSVILFDVDHFKRVNDTRGHQTGDRVLVELARIASDRVRSTDSLARWGGEEFVVLLPNTDGAAACQVADKLRTAIAQTAFEGVGPTTCSFGVAQYWGGDSAEELLARADGALYCAKLNGRDRVELATRHRATMASVA